jgi:hypothetical protein
VGNTSDDDWQPPPSVPTLPITTDPSDVQAESWISSRYRVVRLLGRGGMGEVYEAEDAELGTHIALKVVRGRPWDAEAVAQLKREIQLARKITHPNVCRLHDFGMHHEGDGRDVPFLTMELVEGETLAARIRREGRIAPADAFAIAAQMAAALDAAHEAGVVHRDFKSGNVLLSKDRAIVMDFGLARDALAESGPEASALVGSPAYMAPEQVQGGPLTAAVDVYAFGVVLYEMVTGRLPFSGPTPIDTARMRLDRAAPSPRERVPELDPRWEAAILRCLALAPGDRFARCADAIDVLMRRPDRRRAQRLPIVIGLAAAVLAIALALSWDALATRPRGDAQIAVYDDLASFRAALTRLALAPRKVDFDDVDTTGPSAVRIDADRYARSHGVWLEGGDGVYVDDTFSNPTDFVAVSGRNTFAPGPTAPRDSPRRAGGFVTTVTFRARGRTACVAAFGVHFVDADYGADTGWDAYDRTGRVIARAHGVQTMDGQSAFRGAIALDAGGRAAASICRMRIKNGDQWPELDPGDGVTLDDLVLSPPSTD